MIADLKLYPVVKDSGAPWLGKVPTHWEILPNRALFAEMKEREHPDEQMLSVTITQGVIRQRSLLKDTSKKDSSNHDKSAYKLVCPGDIAYNKMRAWQGAIGVSDLRGIVSPAYVVVRLRRAHIARYFHYLFRTPQFAKEAERWSYGITSDMWSLRPEHFRMIYCVLPPRDEQSGIVRFLDHADRLIRRYIRAKQRLIALLNEQKQAIVHRAITRGIDSHVQLKPSNVGWLGNVPDHWEILPIKRAFSAIDYGISEPASDSGTIRVLTMGNIKEGRVTVPPEGGVSIVDPQLLLAPNDLLFNRTNSAELVGKVGLFEGADTAVTFASYLVRLRPARDHEPEYLNLVLNDQAVLSAARREAIPSLHQSNLNPTRYGRLKIVLPLRDEQRKILRFIREATKSLIRSIASAEHEINFLREYRMRLIADVVTGKLDVREEAARLPTGVEETEPFSESPIADDNAEEEDLDASSEEAAA